MVASIWSSNSDITLTSWRIIHFNLTADVFVSICFCRAFGLAFLLSLNFLFTRGYYSSTRVEIVSTQVEIFQIIAIFFNSVYQVEISNRDENLHIISPLVKSFFRSWILFPASGMSLILNRITFVRTTFISKRKGATNMNIFESLCDLTWNSWLESIPSSRKLSC